MSAKNGQIKNCEHCGTEMYVKKCLLERKRFCSRYCLGKETRLAKEGYMRNTTAWNKGKKGLQQAWNKGLPATWIMGDKNPNWKKGKTELSQYIRTSTEYKNWRTAVYERDGYQCVDCGHKGKGLAADHIYPLAMIIDNHKLNKKNFTECKQLFDLGNGRTLCGDCHSKTDTFGVNFIRWVKQNEYATA